MKVKISKLKLAEYNPRQISDKELTNLKKSLKEFGFIQDVVVNKDFTVISGHQRIRAWKEMGNDTVPIIQVKKCWRMLKLEQKQEIFINLEIID